MTYILHKNDLEEVIGHSHNNSKLCTSLLLLNRQGFRIQSTNLQEAGMDLIALI